MLPEKYSIKYDQLLEEVKAIISETRFNMQTELLKGKWLIGKSVIDYGPPREYGKSVVNKLSEDLGISSRDLYYCINFVEECPDFLDEYGEPRLEQLNTSGKTVTWTKVKTEMLTNSESESCKHEETKDITVIRTVCRNCGEVLETRRIED